MEARRQTRQRVDNLVRFHLHPNHASGNGQHLADRQPQQPGRRLASGERHGMARTRGAIGVARVHQNCARQPMREPQMAPAKLDRRGLHAVLREDGGGGGGKAADNQREIVLLHLAYAGIGGGIEIAKRHLQERYPPRTSLSANRWPFAKSAAGSRLRPSICTSSNSTAAPLPPATTRAGAVRRVVPGPAGRVAGPTRDFQTCSDCPRKVVYAPGECCKHRTWLWLAEASRVQSISPSCFFSSGAQVACAASCFSGTIVPVESPASVSTNRRAPIIANRPPSSIEFSSAPISVSALSSMSPVSRPASIRMVVTPVRVSPLRMAHWMGPAPR